MKSFRVFISSPGDVKEEREHAMNILKEIEDEPAFQRNLHIDVVAWDKKSAGLPMFVNMTPQEAINKSLPLPSECNIVIIILWCKMGTPLPSQYTKEDGSVYQSGTEWEYCDAVKGKNENKPLVLLYRRMQPFTLVPNDPESGEKFRQYSLVEDFFSSFKNSDGSLNSGYMQYNTIAEFTDLFRKNLISVISQAFHIQNQHENTVQPTHLDVKYKPQHNLPSRSFHAYGSLLGRDEDKKRVMHALESRYPLISIEGIGGVGKTSLALEIAYSCLRNPENNLKQAITFEFIVWISAKDKPYEKKWFDEVLNMIARVRDFFSITQKPLNEDKIFEVESLLRQQSTLIIVDNFETIEDPELENWLENVPEPTKVIVTSKRKQFRMSKPIDLEGLSPIDGLELLKRHVRADKGLKFILQKQDHELMHLVTNTAGNPLAILWSLNSVKGGLNFESLLHGLQNVYKNKNINKIIEYVFSESWKRLCKHAQKILLVVPLFVDVELICKESLQAASPLKSEDFDNAIPQLIEFKLLQIERDYNFKEKYKVHPLTHTLAQVKLLQRKSFEKNARRRWSEYYFKYVSLIKREEPIIKDYPYWNALVWDKMKIIDEEWLSINEVIKWAGEKGEDQLFLDLVMLLVHYMDSRFLNLQRTEYVKKGVEISSRLNMLEEEALLRLDALGWTLVEDDNLEDAHKEITCGLKKAEELDKCSKCKTDLTALGFAWQARVEIELGNVDTAYKTIESALNLSSLCNPWIQSRIYMAAGDIALKQTENNKAFEALEFYQKQAECIKKYGGEGNGYQVEPRLGLAYVKTGALEKAEEKFNILKKDETIPIGRLYGEYGLALVAFKRNNKNEARQRVIATKEEISRKTASNIILKLINELYETMELEAKS